MAGVYLQPPSLLELCQQQMFMEVSMKKLIIVSMLITGALVIGFDQGANALMTQTQPTVTQESQVTPVWWRGGWNHRYWGGGWRAHPYWGHPHPWRWGW